MKFLRNYLNNVKPSFVGEGKYSKWFPLFDAFENLFFSYGKHTKNVKYWATPNNGKCLRGFFCGGLYNNKKIDVPKTPPIIPFSSPAIRVNYYNSLEQTC